MVAPKIPRTRYSLFAVLFGGTIALFLWQCVGLDVSTTVLGIGLAFDILGALILAVPDIPSVHQQFYSGKLNEGLNTLSLLGDNITHRTLIEPNTDKELRDGLSVFEPSEYEGSNKKSINQWVEDEGARRIGIDEPNVEGFYEFVETFTEEGYDIEMDNVYGVKSYRENGSVKYVFMRDENGVMKKEGPFNYELAIRRIENYEDKLEARFRRFGLSILIIGFIFQGISLFLP